MSDPIRAIFSMLSDYHAEASATPAPVCAASDSGASIPVASRKAFAHHLDERESLGGSRAVKARLVRAAGKAADEAHREIHQLCLAGLISERAMRAHWAAIDGMFDALSAWYPGLIDKTGEGM